MNAYTLSAVKIGATTLGGIVDQDMDLGVQETLFASDGNVDASLISALAIEPEMGFTTLKIVDALAACGIDGSVVTNSVLYFQLLENGIARAAGFGIQIAKAYLYPDKISAPHGKQATIAYKLIAMADDGQTNPLSSGSLSQPAVNTLAYTLGPVTANGIVLSGEQSWDFDFGLKPKKLAGDGGPFPKLISVEERRPKLTLKGLDASKLYGYVGAAITSVAATLRLATPDGVVGNTAALTLTVPAGRITTGKLSGGKGEVSRDTMVTPRKGASAIVSFTS